MDRGGRGGSVLSLPGAKGETKIIELTAAERTVARRAAESRATVPTLELTTLRSAVGKVGTGALVHACALALREHPRANGAYRDGRFELYSRINIGIVVADAEHYLIPTLFDADTKSAAEVDDEAAAVARSALAGELTAPAYTGATFTIWNATALDLASATIPVVPPQAAVLTAGTAALTLACDHRILYGAGAAAFLETITHHLDGDRI